MRRAASSGRVPSRPSPWMRPVTPALEASVTWSRPPGEDPGHPGVDGAEGQLAALGAGPVGIDLVEDGGQLGGRGVGGEPDAPALELEAGADGAQVLPSEAGSDRDAGGPVPHDGGGPLVGDAHGLDRSALGQAGRRPPRARPSAMAAASNSTSPGNGVSGSTGTWWTCSTVPSGRTTAPRTPEVPTSTTRMLTARAPRRTDRPARACRG